jgi:hypothetical protein
VQLQRTGRVTPEPCTDLPVADTVVKFFRSNGIRFSAFGDRQFEFIREDGDSTRIGTINFSVPEGIYDSVQWRLGTDPRAFTSTSFSLHIDQDLGPMWVQFVGYCKPADPRWPRSGWRQKWPA